MDFHGICSQIRVQNLNAWSTKKGGTGWFKYDKYGGIHLTNGSLKMDENPDFWKRKIILEKVSFSGSGPETLGV